MSSLIKRLLVNQSTRLILMIFLFVILIVLFFLIYGYFNQIKLYEQIQYDKMLAITKTLSGEIDGDKHREIMLKYQEKDDITAYEQDTALLEMHQLLKATEKANKTGSPIYTLIYDPINRVFLYGASSSATPYFRHEYQKYPEQLKKDYRIGGAIPRYSSENGTWISAFSPIRNSKNEVVGIVEADVEFNDFISMARKQVFLNLSIALLFIMGISVFLYRSVKKILIQEEKLKQTLIEQKKLIEDKNKDITDSINYAKKIQDAILPTKDQIRVGLDNFFIMFKPRDIVSGDFYWYHSFDDGSQIIAVGDCTGHGIPGALVSVIGSSLLNEIVKQQQIKSPAKILDLLDKGVNHGLGNTRNTIEQRDGMDISICFVNPQKDKITFAGAFRPMLLIRDGEILEYRGDRFPIGGGDLYEKEPFQECEIDIRKNDSFYMFSDGFPDQFGGPKGKKLMTKKFKDIIQQNIHLTFEDQCDKLDEFMLHWRGDHEQVDDVLVIGFSFPN